MNESGNEKKGFIKITKRSILVAIILMIASAGCSYFAIDRANSSIGTTEKSVYSGSLQTIGYNIEGNKFTTTSDDPQIFIPLDNQNVREVSIYFSEPLSDNMMIQIYYAEGSAAFSEEQMKSKEIMAGESEAVIDIPDADYNSIRVDAGVKQGQSFQLKDIILIHEVNPSIELLEFILLTFLLSLILFLIYYNFKKIDELINRLLTGKGAFAALAVFVFILLFYGMLAGGYKLSYNNIIYAMAPFSSIGVPIAGPLLSDVADAFLPESYNIFFKNGLALWSSSNVFGYSVNPFSTLLYPLNYLYLLGFDIGQFLRYSLKIVIGFTGMALFLKNKHFSKASYIIGAITYTFSSTMIMWGGWPHSDVAMLAPLLFLFADKLIGTIDDSAASENNELKVSRYVILFAITLFFMLVAGMPTYAAYFIYFGFVYTLYQVIQIRKFNGKDITLTIGLLALSMVIAGLMSLAYTGDLFLYTADYQANRAYQSFSVLGKEYIRTLLFPYWAEGFTVHANESTLYTGLLVLFSPLLFLIRRYNKKQHDEFIFFLISSILLIILIFSEKAGYIYQFLPLINTSLKYRVIVLLNFSLSILSCIAVERLINARTAPVNFKVLTGACFIAVPLVTTLFIQNDLEIDNVRNTVLLLWALAIILIVILFTNKKVFILLLCGVVIIDMTSFAKPYIPMIDRNQSSIPKPTESVQYLMNHSNENNRMLALGSWNLFPNINLYYGLNDLGYHGFANTKANIHTFLQEVDSTSYQGPTRTSFSKIENFNLLKYGSVKYILEAPQNNSINKMDRLIEAQKTNRYPYSPFNNNDEFIQTFTATENQLSSINILMSTHGSKLSKGNVLNVILEDSLENTISRTEVPFESISDNTIINISFDHPVSDSKNKEYRLRFIAKVSNDDKLTCWITEKNLYKGKLKINGEQNAGDIVLEPVYGNYINFADGEKVLQITDASPRTFIADNLVIADSEPEVLEEMKKVYLPDTAFISLKEYAASDTLNSNYEPNIQGNARIVRDDGDELIISATTSDKALLVLTDYFDKDWKAYVDGNKTEIMKVNYLFRAVKLPGEGSYTVTFKYFPMTQYICLAISLLGALLMILLIVYRNKFNLKLSEICRMAGRKR